MIQERLAAILETFQEVLTYIAYGLGLLRKEGRQEAPEWLEQNSLMGEGGSLGWKNNSLMCAVVWGWGGKHG